MGELLAYRNYLKNRDVALSRLDNTYHVTYTFVGFRVHSVIVTLYCVLGAFALGMAINQTTTDIIKYSGGRLRPHFLAVCDLDWSRVVCKDPDTDLPMYIENEKMCLGDAHQIKEARLVHELMHVIA